jgi:cardiolipin synthase
VARGLNTRPGTDDDGWAVMPPVSLPDGTTVRLFKDGEALHGWYEAIASAKRSIFIETYIFANDETGRAFQSQLMRKAR